MFRQRLTDAVVLALGRSPADTTASRDLDVLAGTYMVRRLPPWFENIGKRQVKTPKIYFRDTGIYHRLMNIPDRAALATHPKLGPSWEGLALEALITASGASEEEVFFWGVHGQAELDLLIFRGGKRLGYEVKYTDLPKTTRSHRLALEHLRLDRLTVVIPGEADYPLGGRHPGVRSHRRDLPNRPDVDSVTQRIAVARPARKLLPE